MFYCDSVTRVVFTYYQMKIIMYIHSVFCWHFLPQYRNAETIQISLGAFPPQKKDCNHSNEESTMLLRDVFYIPYIYVC